MHKDRTAKAVLQAVAPYLIFVGVAVLAASFVRLVPGLESVFIAGPEGLYLSLALRLGTGYALNFFAPKTHLPSFVWAVFFGMALQPVFAGLTGSPETLAVVVELLAALVLFGGGIEVPFKNFKKYFAPISALSLFGTVLTVVFFSLLLEALAAVFGLAIPTITIIVISSILASIDPTAIIPTLQSLDLKKPFLKDFAVSESAVNDVAGTIFTRFFIVAALSATTYGSVPEAFSDVVSREFLDALALEIIWGLLVGLVGAWMLKRWAQVLEATSHRKTDPALFFAVPVFCFAAGSLIGG
jgi:NhaP-type Na+/H+ or K+/H+ antiporter